MFAPARDLLEAADAANARVGEAQLDLLTSLARIDAEGTWRGEGVRDTAHWVWMRYGISSWKAHRWVEAARPLEGLPHLREVLGTGRLSIDKVVELARFATPDTEHR
jgi:hypothetical protein